jgi:hypothetical protein
MAQFVYELLNWQYFGILAIIWIVADLVWVGKWRSLVSRIGTLISKPWVFAKDKEPNTPPLYPRIFLEQLALYSTSDSKVDTDREPKQKGTIPAWVDAQKAHVFDSSSPIRSIGYLLALAFFVFFLLADTITIANTMVLLGLIDPNLPPVLQRLDLAILGGALLSSVVGVWMLIEMSGKHGELVHIEKLETEQKRIYKIIALMVTLFSAAVMLALAVQRLISLGSLEATQTMDLVLSFTLYGLLAINNSLAAALTFSSAASGLLVLTFLLVGILPLLAFLFDIAWRAMYIVVDISVWALFTPIISIPYAIGKVFGLIK